VIASPLARSLVKPLAGPVTGRSTGGLPYAPAMRVTVTATGSDTDRGTALLAAYATAAALPGLSATNRAVVLLPDGNYKLTAAMVLDTDFVDLAAVVPAMGGRILPTDEFGENNGSSMSHRLKLYRQPPGFFYPRDNPF